MMQELTDKRTRSIDTTDQKCVYQIKTLDREIQIRNRYSFLQQKLFVNIPEKKGKYISEMNNLNGVAARPAWLPEMFWKSTPTNERTKNKV